jgi:hypothetical protein
MVQSGGFALFMHVRLKLKVCVTSKVAIWKASVDKSDVADIFVKC